MAEHPASGADGGAPRAAAASAAPLRPCERGILGDLAIAGVMTTDQIWRLRFPGTGRANCRLHLARLRRRNLVARLPLPGPGNREACWCLTPAGLALTGEPPDRERLWELHDPWRLDAILQQAERFLHAALEQRMGEGAPDGAAGPTAGS